jgi:hypothetical protein
VAISDGIGKGTKMDSFEVTMMIVIIVFVIGIIGIAIYAGITESPKTETVVDVPTDEMVDKAVEKVERK